MIITAPINIEIQIGERTHTQLQVITPTSFKIMNTIASTPKNPIPPEAEDLFSLIHSPSKTT